MLPKLDLEIGEIFLDYPGGPECNHRYPDKRQTVGDFMTEEEEDNVKAGSSGQGKVM